MFSCDSLRIFISEGFAPAAGPLLVGGCLGGCWGSQSGRLGPCLFGFVGLLSCFVLVCLVGVVGLFLFLELGGHLFGDFGVLGSSLDAFGARGGPGSRPCRNSPLH